LVDVSLLSDIRGALQLQAASATGFPAADQIDYEGNAFSPTYGVPWARMTLLNNSRQPFSVSGQSKITGGLFQVDLFYPVNKGTADIDVVADAVVDVFPLNFNLIRGAVRLWINYAQRNPLLQQPDSIHAPITVSWRCFTTT
jgi:hypothetical protein